VKAVLFDLDGVLVDSREVWFQVMRAAALHFGHPDIPREAFDETFGQGVDADIENFMPGTEFSALDRYYDEHFMDHAEHFRADPCGPAVLRDLRAAGVRTAVVTNTSTPLATDILTRVGLEPDTLCGSSDVPRAKPAPDLVLLGLERLEVAAHEAVMVGDSQYDRDSARAAGVRFLGYNGIEGDETLESLEELLARL
jgi:HAD superfamily hydrolase (TIGR01509 family)